MNGQIIDADRTIPGTKTNLRRTLLHLRDNNDNHRIFNSIDVHWNGNTQFVITFRPDKTAMAYSFSNSISTYVHHLYPTADLSQIFTLEAIGKAKEETFHPDLQKFTTQENIALQAEVDLDRDDDSLSYIPEDELPSLDDDLSDAPVKEISNTRVFNLNGETDTVSTMANDLGSVSFQDEVSYREIPAATSEATTAPPMPSDQSNATPNSQDSVNTRITRVENTGKQIGTEVSLLRKDFSQVMEMLQTMTGTSTTKKPLTPANEMQATGNV